VANEKKCWVVSHYFFLCKNNNSRLSNYAL
jgi:hypothetical protein